MFKVFNLHVALKKWLTKYHQRNREVVEYINKVPSHDNIRYQQCESLQLSKACRHVLSTLKNSNLECEIILYYNYTSVILKLF